jgi:hypothetical protein
MSTPRALLRLALVAVLLPVVPACTPMDESAPQTLAEAFDAASAEHDVPRDLLVALAYSQTRFDEPEEGDHEHAGMRGYGVMDLNAGSPSSGPDIARGAGRLGYRVDDAIHDPARNIAVAASELRWRADQIEVETGTRIHRIDDWVEVVGWYSGSEDGGAQRSYAKQVYAYVERGFRAQDPDGNGWITVAGRELDLPMLDLMPAAVGSADSSLVDNIVSAGTCNYTDASRGASSIDTIVVHTAQGSYSGTYNWFQNCSAGASAHYVLRSSDGEITQMVSEADTAWHAGDSGTNSRSVSVELEGYIEDPDRWFTDAMYTSLGALIGDIATRQGVSLDRTRIIGHSEVPGCAYTGGGGRNCHTDPGDGFDWDRLMDSLTSSGSSSSGSGSSSSGSSSSGSSSSGSSSSGSSSSGSSSSGSSTSAGVGDLVGFVRKDSIYNTGSPVAGATVSVSSGQRATTDSRGYFSVDDVPAGAVSLTVSASGYATATDSADIDAGYTNWNSVAIAASSSSSSGSGSSSTSSSGTAAPASLDPSGWETVTSDSVTLSWSNTGASSYEVRIYWWDGSDWNAYYTYTTTSAAKTFWPTVDDTEYAFMVRSVGSSGTSEWSATSYFTFGG